MPEKPKVEAEADEKPCEKPDIAEKSSWSEDQREHGYYYDDAHGYEVFVPEEDEEDESEIEQ